jgi:dihydrofolate reductase
MIRLIAAMDSRRGIATDAGIPWHLPGDSAYFREKTKEGLILMGWTTYSEFKSPLHERTNYVFSPRSNDLRDGFVAIDDIQEFFNSHDSDTVWVVGGSAVFGPSIAVADELFITQIFADYGCTRFFPEFRQEFSLADTSSIVTENDTEFRFERWERSSSDSAS